MTRASAFERHELSKEVKPCDPGPRYVVLRDSPEPATRQDIVTA